MRFSDLTSLFENQIMLEILTESVDAFTVGDYISITNSNTTFVSRLGNEDVLYECKFLSQSYANSFDISSGGQFFCQVINKNSDKSIIEVLMLYDLDVKHESEYNSNGIVISALEGALQERSISQLNDNIVSNYSIEIAGHKYYVLGKHVRNRGNTFILANPLELKYYSVSSRLLEELLPQDTVGGDEYAYVIDSSEHPLVQKNDYNYFLYDGAIQIEDQTKSQRMNELTRAMIESKGDKFVRLWRAYSDAHISLERERKENAGSLTFSRCDNKKGYYSFSIENHYAIDNFFRWCRESSEDMAVLIEQPRGKYTKKFKAVIRDNYAPGEKTVECEIKDKEDKLNNWGGTISVDISGAEAMYDRRIKAFDAIQSSTSANPNIAYLLQGRTENSYSKKQLSDSIKIDEKIIKKYWPAPYEPNESQRRAIEMALATPDFAIIQGPPGTGKTRVIKAIYAHFQSQAKSDGDENRRFLLTAYQRDATKILAGDNDPILGIPILAYYGNKNEDVDAALIDWCKSSRKKLLEKSPEVDDYSIIKESFICVKEIQDELSQCSSALRAIDLVERIIYTTERFKEACISEQSKVRGKKTSSQLSYGESSCNENQNLPLLDKTTQELSDIIDQALFALEKKKNTLKRSLKNNQIKLARYYIKRIPTSPEEWSDNGPEFFERIEACLRELDFIPAIKEPLSNLVEEYSKEVVSFARVSNLKTLLVNAIDNIAYFSDDLKKEIQEIIVDITNCMKAFRSNARAEIISDYASYLYPNGETLLAISKFQQIIAATHQYSARKDLERYHDVLVDEAARSCPADLMIPLACSENRIILVGDQNQLPQFVEDNVLNELYKTCDIEEFSDENDSAEEKDFEKKIRRSMFQYLMNRCENLMKQDPTHARVIALDTQYRMPPVLGDLIARNFYKEIGLHNSTKPQSAFMQTYPLISNQNMVWINAGGIDKKERHNGSYCRKIEAEIIAKYVKAIVESDDWKMLDEKQKKEEIGIITLYSWQKQVIKDELVKVLGDDASYIINEDNDKDGNIGTVDSFQGKEFPIVFLSLVRTNVTSSLGFLVDDNTGRNRQCVALSRAQKCLVIVGNEDILHYNGASKGIPALIDFHKQCIERRPYCAYISE